MAEHTQRVRIGLTGLAFVFLLVLVGAAITGWGAGDDQAGAPSVNNSSDAEPNEPLAEIGAAPGSANSSANKQ